MKRTQVALGILLLVLTACATSNRNAWQQGTTTINVTGTPGARITGFYVQDGQRHPIAGSVPFTLSEPGLSKAEIRKANLADTLTAQTRFLGPERGGSYANMVAPPGVPGVRVVVGKGFSVEHVRN